MVESRGFVNDMDLNKLPIISDFVKKNVSDLNKCEILKLYNWIYNLIMLNLYENGLRLISIPVG